MGRLELDCGSIDCEFGGVSPLASTSVERCHNFFQLPGLVGLMFFSSYHQSNQGRQNGGALRGHSCP